MVTACILPAMNLFNGMSQAQILSAFLVVALFGAYSTLEAVALAAFFVTSKPRHGEVRTAALWHIGAGVWFLLAFVSLVWAAPAERSFVDHEVFFSGERFTMLLLGAGFAVAGCICLVIGFVQGSAQKRVWREAAISQRS